MNKIETLKCQLDDLERKVQEVKHHVKVAKGHPDTQANDAIITLKGVVRLAMQAIVTAGQLQGMQEFVAATRRK